MGYFSNLDIEMREAGGHDAVVDYGFYRSTTNQPDPIEALEKALGHANSEQALQNLHSSAVFLKLWHPDRDRIDTLIAEIARNIYAIRGDLDPARPGCEVCKSRDSVIYLRSEGRWCCLSCEGGR
jgi:hypothetical protein